MREIFHEELPPQEPPMDWYLGIGRISIGIRAIGYNESLTTMGEGQVAHHISEFEHYTGNPITEKSTEERKQRAEQAIAEAEAFITQTTGFTPQEIQAKKHKLLQLYRGKTEAPFPFELY